MKTRFETTPMKLSSLQVQNSRVLESVCTRFSVDKACLRSCVQNACGHKTQMQIWKQPSRPMPRCRLDASESLPKSAVFSARFLPRREINFMRTKICRIPQTTNERKKRVNLSFRVGEDGTPANPLASLPNSCNQSGSRVHDFMFEPSCL